MTLPRPCKASFCVECNHKKLHSSHRRSAVDSSPLPHYLHHFSTIKVYRLKNLWCKFFYSEVLCAPLDEKWQEGMWSLLLAVVVGCWTARKTKQENFIKTPSVFCGLSSVINSFRFQVDLFVRPSSNDVFSFSLSLLSPRLLPPSSSKACSTWEKL